MKANYLIFLVFLLVPALAFGNKKKKVEVVNTKTEKGTITNGYKTGVWEYFDSDTLVLKVDYSKGALIYLKPDTTQYAIETENGWEFSRLDVYPRFIGSMDDFLRFYATHIIYPTKAKDDDIQGTVLLYFEINIQGHVDHIKIVKDIGDGCGDEVMSVFRDLPNYWLTAKKNGQNYVSRYILPVKFRMESVKISEKELQEVEKVKKEYMPVRFIPEMVITVASVGDFLKLDSPNSDVRSRRKTKKLSRTPNH